MSNLISTSTVFHFTRSIDNLESILKEGFTPHLCKESIFETISNATDIEKYIPMVSFCDIPLSQISNHVDNYGSYALGLSKEWAITKKINPVLYTYTHSDIANKLTLLFKGLVDMEKKIYKDPTKSKFLRQYMSIIQYVKPYEGLLWKEKNWSEKKIRFYDEREWRYIPQVDEGDMPLILHNLDQIEIDSLNEKKRESGDLNLSFEPQNVNFIIVQKESEILEIIKKVRKIKEPHFTPKEIQILITRIISMETINKNI